MPKYPFSIVSSELFLSKRLFARKFSEHASLFQGRVLDVGSGRSPLRNFLSIRQYVSMDVNLSAGPLVAGSLLSLPFAKEAFQGLIATEVLEHVPNPFQAFAEMTHVLQPGGVLYLTVPMSWYLHYEPHDYFRFTKHGLAHLAREFGYRNVKIERLGGLAHFLAVRGIEALFQIFHKLLFWMRLWPRARRQCALWLLLPFQLFGLLFTTLLDRWSRRDATGWLLVARRS